MQRFNNKVAFVTGAASGIGLATVKRLAQEGASVFACDINDTLLQEELKSLIDSGLKVTPHKLDVSDTAACQAAIAEAVNTYGQLDILCNVAGIIFFAHFTEMKQQQWDKIIAINLTAVAVLCQAALPHLLKTKGNIVNVASTAAITGLPHNAAYCASKGGVLMLTKALAVEYASQSVRINAICPGGVNTPLAHNIELPEDGNLELFGRSMPLLPIIAEPEDIASGIAYLACDEARFVTGADFVVDGGSTVV